MTRLFGPDQSERVPFYTSGSRAGNIYPPGTAIPLYATLSANSAADVLAYDGTAIATVSGIPTLYTSSTYEIPLFRLPDVADPVVYTRIGNGPVVPLHPRTDDRIDTLTASLAALDADVVHNSGYSGERFFEISFVGGAANQKSDITFGDGAAYTFATVEVTLTGIYEDEDATGTIRAVYSLASSFGATFVNDMTFTVVQGTLPDHFTLSSATWDAGSHQWSISVAHLTSTTNAVSVRVQWQAAAPVYADGFLDSLNMSAVHTTDTTVVPVAALPIQPTHPTAPAYNVTPANLGKWRAALAAMRQGSAQAKILCVGDSTTIGYGVSVQGSWPSWLVRMLNAPAAMGFAVARHPSVADSRWTLGTGWAYLDTGIGFGRASAYGADTSASGALVFNPGIEIDTVDIYFAASPSYGTSVVTIAGTTTNLVTGLSAGFKKQTLTRSAGFHTISIARPTVGPMTILGIDAYLSTAAQIRVGNAGASGTNTVHWTYVGDVWNSLAGLATYDPDLTIFMLGINDTALPLSLEAFRANVETFGTVAETYGSFMLMSTIPSQDGAASALESSYRNVLRELSASHGWPMVDIYERFGSYTITNGLGFMSDTIHGSATGYADLAAAPAAVLNGMDDSASARVAAVGAWTSYTPTLGSWTIGNGDVAGRYTQIGKTVHWGAEITMGSTSTYGGGATVSLPVTKTTAQSAFPLNVMGVDSGNNLFLLFGFYVSTTAAAVYGQTTAGEATVGGSAPFTWSTGDTLYIMGTYEAA